MIAREINIISQPGQQIWPGLAWNLAGYIGWTDQARPIFQNSAWTGGLAWQATRRLPGPRPGRQLCSASNMLPANGS
jgi:hypothetical protein